jgi:hypothetical protein
MTSFMIGAWRKLYSHHSVNRLVWYSNGGILSDYQMVRYSNGVGEFRLQWGSDNRMPKIRIHLKSEQVLVRISNQVLGSNHSETRLLWTI